MNIWLRKKEEISAKVAMERMKYSCSLQQTINLGCLFNISSTTLLYSGFGEYFPFFDTPDSPKIQILIIVIIIIISIIFTIIIYIAIPFHIKTIYFLFFSCLFLKKAYNWFSANVIYVVHSNIYS